MYRFSFLLQALKLFVRRSIYYLNITGGSKLIFISQHLFCNFLPFLAERPIDIFEITETQSTWLGRVYRDARGIYQQRKTSVSRHKGTDRPRHGERR